MSKVLISFTDRVTREYYRAGDLYDGTPERIAELTDRGYLAKEEKKITVLTDEMKQQITKIHKIKKKGK